MVLNNNYDSYNCKFFQLHNWVIIIKVKNLVNLWSPEGILSVTLISSAFVMSIFFGIKLRWFRYRMKFPSVEEESTTSPPVLLRTHSMTDVRQGCSNGRYSYFEDNSTAVSTSNYSPITSPPTTSTISTSPTTSSNVKSKKSK